MEDIDEHDETVLAQLGYAVARAQLLEFAMLKLLEVQRHDLSVPLDERWPEIRKWLKMPAGATRGELSIPTDVANDLEAVIARRNRVVHRSWTNYQSAREMAQGKAAAGQWVEWLAEQSAMLGYAYNGVIAITDRLRDGEVEPTDDDLVRLWREHVREALPQP